MKKIFTLLLFFFISVSTVYSSEIKLAGVPWISQMDCKNGLGTCKSGTQENDWSVTMNCGPTSVMMLAGYLRNFSPTINKVKDFDDWLYKNSLISSINNYNLPASGVGHWALRSGAAYYFGLWNSRYHKTVNYSKDDQIVLIKDSLQAGRPSIVGVKTYMSTTGAYHWMVAIGLKDTNNDGDYFDSTDEILVNDPGRSSEYEVSGDGKGRKWYSISAFKDVLFGTIIFNGTYEIGEYSDLYSWHNEDEYSDWSEDVFQDRPSQPFVDYFLNAGVGSEDQISGIPLFGVPVEKAHLFPVGYVSNNFSIQQTWIQNFFNAVTVTNYLFVYNPVISDVDSLYSGSVFSVIGKIREYYIENYWYLGYPVCNEYNEEQNGYNYVVQWFVDGNSTLAVVAYNLDLKIYNDLDLSVFDIDERIQLQLNVNIGYSEEGFGVGGGGEEPPLIDPPDTDGYTLNRATICKDIMSEDDGYLPINETTSFIVNDGGYIYSWLQLDDISTKVRIDWYWYNPNGNIAFTGVYYANEYYEDHNSWLSWNSINLNDITDFGRWKVRIFLDEEMVLDDYFDVLVNLSPPQNIETVYDEPQDQISINWSSVPYADTYYVYRNDVMIAETVDTGYWDTGVVDGTSYIYKIVAVRGNRTSSFSDGVMIDIPCVMTIPSVPLIKAEDFIQLNGYDVDVVVAIKNDDENVFSYVVSLYPTKDDWLAGMNAYSVIDVPNNKHYSQIVNYFTEHPVIFIGVKAVSSGGESEEAKTFLLPGDCWDTAQQDTDFDLVRYGASDKYFIRHYTG